MKLITYSASPIPFHLFLLLCPQLAGAHICLGSARSRISLGMKGYHFSSRHQMKVQMGIVVIVVVMMDV